MFRLIKAVIAAVIIVLFLFAFLTGYGMLNLNPDGDLPVCNLNDYVMVIENGKDGQGTVSMELDTEGIIRDYGQYLDNNAVSKTPDWLQKVTDPLVSEEAVRVLFNGVNLEDHLYTKAYNLVLSKDKGLSNGDEIIVQWADTPASVGALKLVLPINFQFTPFSYTVQNLEVVEAPNTENPVVPAS